MPGIYGISANSGFIICRERFMKKSFLFCWILLLSCFAYGEIHRVETFDKLWTSLDEFHEETLIVFDVDYVILMPKDAVLRRPHGDAVRSKMHEKYISHLPEEEQNRIHTQTFLDSPKTLVDRGIPRLIEHLHERSIKTIALTALQPGPLGSLASSEDWRINQLKEHGVDFSFSFPSTVHMILSSHSFCSPFPVFKQGILFSRPHSKGEVLSAFLKQISWKPSLIIFIDDSLNYLKSVQTAMQRDEIPFLGLHYIGAETIPCEIDEEIAEMQFKILIETGIWMSDEEVKALLQREAA
jgi:hypothetical protein